MDNKDNNNKSETDKLNLSPEQLKKFIEMSMNKNAGGGKPLTQNQLLWQQALKMINEYVQKGQYYLDRFINFITKKIDKDRNEVVGFARSPILFGTYVILIFVVIGGLWMSFAPLNSAAVAIGTVVSNTNKKIIQNADTGIIKAILVKLGDKVHVNQPLIELDDVRAKADYENILYQYRLNLAAEYRLIAERDGLEEIKFPPFLTDAKNNAEVKNIMQVQENIFKYKKQLFSSNKTNLKHKIEQANKTIDGLKSKLEATQKNLDITRDRVNAMADLNKRQIVSKSALLELQGREASLKGDLVGVESEIARVQEVLAAAEIDYTNIDNEYLTKTLAELKEVQAQRLQAQEKYPAASSALEHVTIKSPVEGTVNVVHHHTIGGVVGAGTPLLEISPTNDSLVIEAKIDTKHISAVREGLKAKIRFSAFKSRTTPLFTGRLVSLSPDIVQDKNPQQQQMAYYLARVEINMEHFNKIAKQYNLKLQPGMQAEVQIITGKKTLLRYLLDPLTDTMFRAFREK